MQLHWSLQGPARKCRVWDDLPPRNSSRGITCWLRQSETPGSPQTSASSASRSDVTMSDLHPPRSCSHSGRILPMKHEVVLRHNLDACKSSNAVCSKGAVTRNMLWISSYPEQGGQAWRSARLELDIRRRMAVLQTKLSTTVGLRSESLRVSHVFCAGTLPSINVSAVAENPVGAAALCQCHIYGLYAVALRRINSGWLTKRIRGNSQPVA